MSWDPTLIPTDAKSILRRPPPPSQQGEPTSDRTVYGWLCPVHHRATVRPSAKGRPNVACPECHRFDKGGAPAPVAPTAHRPGTFGFVVAQAPPLQHGGHRGCPECSRAVTEAPSAIAAFASLVLTNAHRQHVVPTADPLPF